MSGMTAIGSALLGGGAGLSAYGSYAAGRAQQEAANLNAQLEEQQGEIARGQSFTSAEQVSQKVQQTLGAQRAAYGAAGIDIGTGSPLEVMAESARRGELARMATLFQGRAQQEQAQNQAAIDRYSGKVAKQAGIIAAGTTLLTAAAKAATAGGGGIPQWNA